MNINHLDHLHQESGGQYYWWAVRRYKPNSNPIEWIDDDWQPLYVPSTPCRVEHSNIASNASGRDDSGNMHIFWLRSDVKKVILHYNAITGTELAYMQNLLQGRQFYLKYLEYERGQSINAYAGESNYEIYTYSGNDIIFQNYEIHLIQM